MIVKKASYKFVWKAESGKFLGGKSGKKHLAPRTVFDAILRDAQDGDTITITIERTGGRECEVKTVNAARTNNTAANAGAGTACDSCASA